MKKNYQLPYIEVIDNFNSKLTGLSNEAVSKQREIYGKNQIEESQIGRASCREIV